MNPTKLLLIYSAAVFVSVEWKLVLSDEKAQSEESHVHVMMCIDNARRLNGVAKKLSDKSQYVEAWKGKAENGFTYLFHATDKARTKHQYSNGKTSHAASKIYRQGAGMRSDYYCIPIQSVRIL